jgi:DNA (cytosine-5)-methyltransferase 1
MTIGSLFSGIGGFELGLLAAGMGPVKWQVENDEYCRKILDKRFPETEKFGDIHDIGKHNLEPVDVICGGAPCQPFSVAGVKRGTEDDRHLWPEMARIIDEIRPNYVIAENVTGIVKMELDTVLSDLESIGYTCGTFIIPAVSVNAAHRRDRVWVVANTDSARES